MAEQLDRTRPFCEVQGDSLASFYQNGEYFDSNYQRVSAEDAAKPSLGGSFTSQVEQRVQEEMAKENAKRELKLVDETNPSTNSAADIEKARARAEQRDPEPQPVQTDEEKSRLTDQLKGMHASEVRKLVELAGLTPETGRGSKARNIQLLVDNTD